MQNQRKIETEFIRKIQKHQGILHKICFVYTDSKVDNEDLYQEMVLQLWKSYPSFRKESKFSTWMYRVALNTALLFNKKRTRFTFVDAPIPDTKITKEINDYSEDVQILYKAISKLSKIEKAIILLWLEEKTYAEIGNLMGISEKNISVKLVRIKKKLAKLIKMLS